MSINCVSKFWYKFFYIRRFLQNRYYIKFQLSWIIPDLFTFGFDLEIWYWLEITYKYGFICVNRAAVDIVESRLHSTENWNHFTVWRLRYGFYILIIAYPLISFRAVNRSPKNPYIKRALGREVKHKSERSERWI